MVAVGRQPNGKSIGAELAGVNVDERGFIAANKQQRTNINHIFAIGDVIGNPMLAHKAVHEGKVAAEVAAGHKSAFDALTIPSVAYTDPEIAWMGLTENQAKQQGIEYGQGRIPLGSQWPFIKYWSQRRHYQTDLRKRLWSSSGRWHSRY